MVCLQIDMWLPRAVALHLGTISEFTLEQKQLSLFPRSDSFPSKSCCASKIMRVSIVLHRCCTNTNIGYGQCHKTLQDIINLARERKVLFATKARYAGTYLICYLNSIKLKSHP